jgi:hypothetical protein
MSEKPIAAFVISLVGGILILLFGAIFGMLAILGGLLITIIPALGAGLLGGLVIIFGI